MNNDFLIQMQSILQDEYEAYINCLDKPANKGFRINTLKTTSDLFFNNFDLPSVQSKFAKNAYRFLEDKTYGNTVFHAQGLIYIQEPSASSVADLLDVKPNDYVLDLCAAPGGKTTQLAAALNNKGLLVANEIENSRVLKLLSNIERWGATNTVIMNEKPANIAKVCFGFFDKILVDAPCSGEGMFKKHDKAIEDWSLQHVKSCANRQKEILEEAYKMLKQEGTLVYSTCTLNLEENEKVIEQFIQEHPDMELIPINVEWGRCGYKTSIDTTKCRRVLPMDDGEGQFMAKMIKHGETKSAKLKTLKSKLSKEFMDFINDQCSNSFEYYYEYKDKCYAGSMPFYDFESLRITRQMILCGEIIKKRFEPHHHFYMCSNTNFNHSVELNDEQMNNFYKGNTINIPVNKGYVALLYKGNCIGFGKSDGTILKNKLPKGLRF